MNRGLQFGVRWAAAGLVAALLAVGVAAQPRESPAATPFRMVPLSPDGIPAALAEVEQGTLVRLAATDFDRLVRAASKGDPAAALLTTRYRARVTFDGGEPRLTGTGEWVVRSPGPRAALRLPAALSPLRQAKWSDGRDAVLFKSPRDDQPRLVAPAAGDLALNLDWSARGFVEPGEVRFELRLPPSPVASLDLELPPGYVPVVSADDALLTGPHPADAGTAWRLSFSGADRLTLVFRRVEEGKPRLFARLVAWQRLTGGEGTASFDFQIDSAKGGFTDLEFAFDPGLTPTAVRANNLAGWTVPPDAGPTRRLLVRLSEPTRSAKVEVAGTLALPLGSAPWVSPALTLKDAISRGERLQLSVAPALRFRDWRPGDYRLVKAEGGFDGSYLLDVEPGLLPADRAVPVRPSLVVTRPSDRAWKAVQRAEWLVGPAGEDWSVRTEATVFAGAVSTVGFRIPDGWSLDRVEVNGSEATADVAGGQMSVDLGRVVRPGDTVEVTTRFWRRRDPKLQADGLPFPDLTPVGSVGRDGRLVIRVDPVFEAVPTDPPRDETRAPAGPADSTVGIFERVLTAEPLVGRLYCRPRAARPTAEVRTELWSGTDGATARTVLTVRPGGGPVSAVTVWTPHVSTGPLVWHDSLGRRAGQAVRLPAVDAARWLVGLGARTPLAAAVGSSVTQATPGAGWSIQFPKPITEPTTLTTEYTVGGTNYSGLSVIGMPFVGTVRITDPAGERSRRYGSGAAGSDEPPGDRPPPTYDGLRLLTIVNGDGRTEAAFRFRVRGPDPSPIAVQLPNGTRLLGVMVAGRPVPGLSGSSFEVPLPRTDDWTEVEIGYAGPDLGPSVFVRPDVGLPKVPFDTGAVRRVWHISPAWRVAARSGVIPVPGTTSDSADLPLPDWRATIPNEPAFDAGTVGGPGVSLRSALRSRPQSARTILDTFALAGAGVAVDLPLAPGETLEFFLADRGLIVGNVGETRVLTTAAYARRFRTDPTAARALADANEYGQDATGRFQVVDRTAQDVSAAAPEGWGVWIADDPTTPAPLLVRNEVVTPSAWGAVVLLFLGALAVRGRPRVRFVWMLVWSGAAVAGTVLGEDALAAFSRPVLFGAIAAGMFGCLRVRPAPVAERPSRRLELAGGAVALVLAAGAHAAEPVPVVYRLPAEEGRPASVLAPPKLLDDLRRSGADRPALAIIEAEYDGTRVNAVCRFQARFHLWAFEDAAARLTLPFQSVKLREVRLDGAEAGGVTVGPDGLSVPIAGRGDHVLELRFEVPVGMTATDREVKFAVPEVPISRLKFESSRLSPKPRLGPWRGAVRTTTVGDTDHLEVDLGATPNLQLRWAADASGNPSPVRAREAAVWHVGGGAARLESLTELRTSGAGPNEVQLAVPAAAEVFRVGVRTDGLAVGGAAARIQSWSIGPPSGAAERTLTVSFQSPLEGRAVLELEMYGTGRWADRPVLSVPRLLKVAEVESHAAIVLSGTPAVEATGLTEEPADTFLKGVWTPLGGSPVRPTRAYRAAGPAHMTPSLRPSAAAGAVSELTWWVEDKRLVGRGTSRVPGTPGLGLVEWRVRDGVRVTDVTGPRLFTWAQVGDRVQAWFDRPILDGTIRWAAERPRANPSGDTTIPVPDFGPASATTVRARPTGGLALSGRGELLPPTSPGEVAWRAGGAEPGRLTVWGPQAVGLPITTTIRRADRDLEAVSTIDLSPLQRDCPHRLSVFVTGADRAVVAGSGLAAAEVPSETGGRRWDVAIPAGRTTDALTVTVRRPEAKWQIPKVSVRAGPGAATDFVRTIRLDQVDAGLVDVAGLTATGPAAWRADTPNWDATVVRRTKDSGPAGRHLTGVIEAARSGRGWIYHGRFELTTSEAAAARVVLPSGSNGTSVSVDDVAQPFQGPAVAFPAGTGPRSVVVRWTTPEPSWRVPRFETTGGEPIIGPMDWIVTVPPGLRAEGPTTGGTEPTTAEELFRRGLRIRFRAETAEPPDVRLVPEARPWGPVVLAFGLWFAFVVLLLWPTRLQPERAATLGAVGAVAFGPAGAALWLVPIGALLYRVGFAFSRLWRRANSVPKSVP
jgi:hypothetical protein